MSDQFEFNELIKSLNVTPDEEAKQKAKALFLQKAEEAEQTQTAEHKKTGSVFRKNRRSLFNFAAGMAAMLILTVGILTAYDPSFLTGSVSGGGDIVQYRMFPAGTETPVLDTAQKYSGELSVFHIPGADEDINSQFIKSDGAAFAEGFAYYVTQFGSKADTGKVENTVTKGKVLYVPVNRSDYKADYGNAVCCGEIVLLKASDKVLQKHGYLPCKGQTLNAKDYPVLAGILAPGAEQFTLPDLSGQSPVEGAVWCIAAEGDYPYTRPAGN
ncbi:phage tail protein [Pelotomaculum propionicicum]|jgi:hypothetical protein|uniref:Phage tail collar domain-containing protein n=1 Tax=Pelotomaculum propionicicum TaxID=258475 RepID=A0A4Y7RK69_9FIRM|nr:phage tail protein [Pelotomaculum propionicicum]NLI13974.1 tail fiber protein [Peptococcaceae bacterium]TEB09375.1 hypothetical protein Pmgp_03196 [Pelotomaculum propionicicum]